MPYTITLIRDSEIATLPPNETQPPPHIKGHCGKCGNCCEYHDCPALDKVSRECKVYPNRPTACRMWPLVHDYIDMFPGCTYHVDDEQ